MKHRLLKSIIMIFTIAFLFTGCNRNRNVIDSNKTYVYFLNHTGTQLYPVEYVPSTTDMQGMAEEFMNMLINPPQDKSGLTPMDETVEFSGIHVENNIVTISFDSNYQNMKTTRRTLCNAALTDTFTQIPGISYINIVSGGQPLMNDSGTPVGLLKADDFITSVSDINAFTHNEITLFFATEDGQQLVSEKREVVYNMNTPIEKVVIEEIISGPANAGHLPVVDPSAKLLSISVNEGTCYVNFDESFLTPVSGEADYITIHSIVNSLSELPTVNRVQIMVNSSKDVTFRENISLGTSFERNLEYIKGE